MTTQAPAGSRRQSVAKRAASTFFAANTRASKWCETRFGWQSDKPFWQHFADQVAEAARLAPPGAVVVDIGGGRRCVWARAAGDGVHIIAVDIDPDELTLNTDVTETRVGDVSQGLPLADGEAVLITSRALLEHVDGVRAAAGHMARALAPGGRTLHFVPARYSLFGLAARLGPFEALRDLVHLAIPSSRNQVEFPVFYDHCSPAQLERAFADAGFSSVKTEVCYSQSGYFHPVFPLYLLVAAYQGVVARLGLRQAAAYVIVDARR